MLLIIWLRVLADCRQPLLPLRFQPPRLFQVLLVGLCQVDDDGHRLGRRRVLARAIGPLAPPLRPTPPQKLGRRPPILFRGPTDVPHVTQLAFRPGLLHGLAKSPARRVLGSPASSAAEPFVECRAVQAKAGRRHRQIVSIPQQADDLPLDGRRELRRPATCFFPPGHVRATRKSSPRSFAALR